MPMNRARSSWRACAWWRVFACSRSSVGWSKGPRSLPCLSCLPPCAQHTHSTAFCLGVATGTAPWRRAWCPTTTTGYRMQWRRTASSPPACAAPPRRVPLRVCQLVLKTGANLHTECAAWTLLPYGAHSLCKRSSLFVTLAAMCNRLQTPAERGAPGTEEPGSRPLHGVCRISSNHPAPSAMAIGIFCTWCMAVAPAPSTHDRCLIRSNLYPAGRPPAAKQAAGREGGA